MPKFREFFHKKAVRFSVLDSFSIIQILEWIIVD